MKNNINYAFGGGEQKKKFEEISFYFANVSTA